MTDFSKRLEDAKKPKKKRAFDTDPMTERIQASMSGKPGPTVPAIFNKATEEATGKLSLIKKAAEVVTIITSDALYAEADMIRGEIDQYIKWWTPQAESVIRPQYQALEAMYALNRNMLNPALELKEKISVLMRDYQRLQLKAKQDAIAEANRVAEEARIAAEKAKTPQLKARMENKAVEAKETAQAIQEVRTTQASNSYSRPIKKWKVNSLLELLKGVMSGEVPQDMIQVNEVQANKYFREDQATFGQYPGIEVYDDVQIASGKRFNNG